MLRFLFFRFVQGILVVLGVLCITFLLLRQAPGGPFQSERNVEPHIRARQEAHYGYDKPWYVQLGRHIAGFATFDFPPSNKLKGMGVEEVIMQALPVSTARKASSDCT